VAHIIRGSERFGLCKSYIVHRRDNILYNPADEAGAHLIALGMTMVFTVLSAEYGWMELAAFFGFGLLVVMFIYYVLYSGEGET
jgi:hypothetical protein